MKELRVFVTILLLIKTTKTSILPCSPTLPIVCERMCDECACTESKLLCPNLSIDKVLNCSNLFEHVDLSNNRISNLYPTSFQKYIHLKTLDLSYNLLTSISWLKNSFMKRLSYINLTGNDIPCDNQTKAILSDLSHVRFAGLNCRSSGRVKRRNDAQAANSWMCHAHLEKSVIGPLNWTNARIRESLTVACPSGPGIVRKRCQHHLYLSRAVWSESDISECWSLTRHLPQDLGPPPPLKKRLQWAKGRQFALESIQLLRCSAEDLKGNNDTQDVGHILKILDDRLTNSDHRTYFYADITISALEVISNLLQVKTSSDHLPPEVGVKFIQTLTSLQLETNTREHPSSKTHMDNVNKTERRVVTLYVPHSHMETMTVSVSAIHVVAGSYYAKFYGFTSNGNTSRLFHKDSPDTHAPFSIAVPRSAVKPSTEIRFSVLNRNLYFAATQKLSKNQSLSQQILSTVFHESRSWWRAAEPVVIRFLAPTPDDWRTARKPSCVFWDLGGKQRSTVVCSTSMASVRERTVITCECTQPGYFSVLWTEYKRPHLSFALLTFCTAVSVAGLLFTIAISLRFIQFRTDASWKVVICLSVTFLCTNFFFVVANVYTNNDWGCKVVGMLLHFFYMSFLLWTTVDVMYLYYVVVKEGGSHVNHFLLKAGTFTLSAPAVLVGITLIWSHENYDLRPGYMCFLTMNPYIWAFAVPAVFLMVFNIVAMFLVAKKIRASRAMFADADSENSDWMIKSMIQIVGLILVCSLPLCTWSFHFIAETLTPFTSVWSVIRNLFVIFHALQGIVVFVHYCFLRKSGLTAWRNCYGFFFRWRSSEDCAALVNFSANGPMENETTPPHTLVSTAATHQDSADSMVLAKA